MSNLGVLYRKPGSLPSLPTVYHHVQRVVNDPNASIEMIVQIVGEDPGLTLRLLRLSNSSFYGFPQKINTLDEAVRLIGLKQVRDLCLATVLLEVFPQEKLECEFANGFWKHSIACGIATRLLAQAQGQHRVEKYFVMGLLHDIGKLPILMHEREKFDQILQVVDSSGRSMYQVETELLGYNHTEVGALILKEWKMPQGLIDIVQDHHDPQKIISGSQEIALVHVANLLSHALAIGTSGKRWRLLLKKKPGSDLNSQWIAFLTFAKSWNVNF